MQDIYCSRVFFPREKEKKGNQSLDEPTPGKGNKGRKKRETNRSTNQHREKGTKEEERGKPIVPRTNEQHAA
jgi:hypothetical protein